MIGNENRNPSTGNVVAAVLHDVLTADRFATLADLVDALKRRLARLRIRYTNDDVSDALRIVGTRRTLLVDAPDPPRARRVEDRPDAAPPVSTGEARAILRQLRDRTGVAPVVRAMPRARRVSAGDVDRARAIAMVLDEIQRTADRCDALERKAATDGVDPQ